VNDDVTVVISCFNYGRFVSEAVASALSQDGGEPRVVVVDDGSTEPLTLHQLERLPEQVRVIRQPNAGWRRRAIPAYGTFGLPTRSCWTQTIAPHRRRSLVAAPTP
jgi:cellulose synthase/poly-beta-1,6-N-acetylglucosamine synthase-like glycosyltransferase